MKKLFLIFVLLTLVVSCSFAENILVKNPVEHFINSHQLSRSAKILYFEVDFNADKKVDIFISSSDSNYHNGQLGNIYQLYIYKNGKYLFNNHNTITIHYDKLIFNDNSYFKYHVPFIIVEEHTVWGCSYKNDRIKEFKLCDIKWGNYPHSPDIFHAILEQDTKKIHPLVKAEWQGAIERWDKYIQKQKQK